jgi:hypothetical protein
MAAAQPRAPPHLSAPTLASCSHPWPMAAAPGGWGCALLRDPAPSRAASRTRRTAWACVDAGLGRLRIGPAGQSRLCVRRTARHRSLRWTAPGCGSSWAGQVGPRHLARTPHEEGPKCLAISSAYGDRCAGCGRDALILAMDEECLFSSRDQFYRPGGNWHVRSHGGHGSHDVHGGHGSHGAHGTRSRIRSDGAGPVGVAVKITHRLGIEPDMSKHKFGLQRLQGFPSVCLYTTSFSSTSDIRIRRLLE